MASICVFCGSQAGVSPLHALAAAQVGHYLARQQHTLVYGGGCTGMMGVLADSVLSLGGQITGVIPRHLARAEIMHSGFPDMRITACMHERKALMHRLADAYVALPGGFGTLEELFETVTWAQLDLHARPIAVLNIDHLYDGLLQMLRVMEEQQFLSDRCRRLLTVVPSVSELTQWLETVV